jgi:hypothetical protein
VLRADHLSRGVLPSVECLNECDLETSTMRRPRLQLGCWATGGGGGVEEFYFAHIDLRLEAALNQYISIIVLMLGAV